MFGFGVLYRGSLFWFSSTCVCIPTILTHWGMWRIYGSMLWVIISSGLRVLGHVLPNLKSWPSYTIHGQTSWTFIKNADSFTQENTFENIVCKKSAILFSLTYFLCVCVCVCVCVNDLNGGRCRNVPDPWSMWTSHDKRYAPRSIFAVYVAARSPEHRKTCTWVNSNSMKKFFLNI